MMSMIVGRRSRRRRRRQRIVAALARRAPVRVMCSRDDCPTCIHFAH